MPRPRLACCVTPRDSTAPGQTSTRLRPSDRRKRVTDDAPTTERQPLDISIACSSAGPVTSRPRHEREHRGRRERGEQSRVAVARGQLAVAEGIRIRAEYEQRLVEAEVAATRRRLLRLARGHGAALGFLNQEFLKAAIEPRCTRREAIVRAAADMEGVNGVDLQQAVARSAWWRAEASGTDSSLGSGRSSPPKGPAWVLAWSTRRPVLVHSVERSVIFARAGALDPMMGSFPTPARCP